MVTMKYAFWMKACSVHLPQTPRCFLQSPFTVAQGIIAQQQQRISNLEVANGQLRSENGQLRANEHERQRRALAESEKRRRGGAVCLLRTHSHMLLPLRHGMPP